MRVAVVVAVACLSAVSLCAGQDVKASIKKSTNIPAQELVPALKALAHERGFQMVFRSEVVGAKRTYGAVGDLTTTEALTMLLEGTDLVYSYLDEKTVTILPVNSGNKLGPQDPSTGNSQHCSGISSDKSDYATALNRTGWGSTGTNWTGSEGASDCVESHYQQNKLLASAIAAGAETAPVRSSNGESSSNRDSTPRSDDAVEEILVTAQKRVEPLQKVPVTISAVSEEQLSAYAITNNDQLVTLVPGLEFVQASTGAQPFLRGIGFFTGQPGNEPPVATYVDGVYHPSADSALFSYNGVAQIEVDKGPQGTLYGRNAAGGVINIKTKTPQHDPALDLNVGYANYSTFSGNLYATGGVTDTIAADISLTGSDQRDGWGKNRLTGEDSYLANNFAIRSKWLWTPRDSTTVTAAADYDKTRNDGGLSFAVAPGALSVRNVPHVGGFYDTNSSVRQYGKNSQGGAYLKIEQGLGFGQITNLTSWRTARVTAQQNSSVGIANEQYAILKPFQRTWTEELSLQSLPSSNVAWIVGFFYFWDRSGYEPFAQLGTVFGLGPSGGAEVDSLQKTTSYAGYAQATAPLWSDSDHLTLGFRYSSDRRSIDGTRQLTNGTVTPFVFTNPTSFRQSKPTWRVAYNHDFSSNAMGYLSYSRGFKSGNYNLTNPAAAATLPEVLDSIEGGFKSNLFDRRLQLNFAAFHYKFTDLQVLSVGAGGIPVQSNAAAARYYGFESQVTIRPSRALQIDWNTSVIDSKYTSFARASFVELDANQKFVRSFVGDAAGNDAAFAQPFSTNVSMQYRIQSSLGEITPSVNVSYHDGYYFDAQSLFRQRSRTLVGGTLGLVSESKQWDATLFVRNLLNERSYVNLGVSPAAGLVYSAASPRTYGVTLGYHF